MSRAFPVVLLWISITGIPLSSHGEAVADKPGTSGALEASAWAPPKHVRVVAHRFRIPGEESGGSGDPGFSLLTRNHLDEDLLKRQTVKSAELNPSQVEKLIRAVNGPQKVSPFACYDPHHIFVFYSDTGTVAAAVEVCFDCLGLAALPGIAEPRWGHHDYFALALLVDEAGLWPEKADPVREWIRIREEWDEASTVEAENSVRGTE